ncbi:MAG: hypothetical protein J5I81_03910 [Nitrococcus mobilis]|nr:hypothetical protein [Nitrococcus mobilis]
MTCHTRYLAALAIAANALSVLTGCAAQPEVPEEVVVKPMRALESGRRDLYARVEWIDLDPHTVVARVGNYRHALSGRRRELGPSARVRRPQTAGVSPVHSSQNEGAQPEQAIDGSDQGGVEDAPIASAWLTYCDAGAPMSAKDWAYIKSHGGIAAVPEAIADTCVYRK